MGARLGVVVLSFFLPLLLVVPRALAEVSEPEGGNAVFVTVEGTGYLAEYLVEYVSASTAAWDAAVAAAAYAAALEEQRWELIRARWWRVGRCEQPTADGGIAWALVSWKFSGGLGISNAAWVQWGGIEFATNAGLATPDEQMVIAERILAGTSRASWGCPVP